VVRQGMPTHRLRAERDGEHAASPRRSPAELFNRAGSPRSSPRTGATGACRTRMVLIDLERAVGLHSRGQPLFRLIGSHSERAEGAATSSGDMRELPNFSCSRWSSRSPRRRSSYPPAASSCRR
jgi:hypothetical protein